MRVRSLASLSVSGIWHCRELWCRSKTQLGFHVAAAVVWAGSCSCDLTPSLGTSLRCRRSPKKKKKKVQNRIAILCNKTTSRCISKKLKAGSPRDSCITMFTAALFAIVKMQKQPNCPSTGECTNYIMYIAQCINTLWNIQL